MWDLILGSAQAYQQVGLFLGALVCLALGALVLGNVVVWSVHSLRATGTIIGVIAEGRMYASVYRYTSPDGRIVEAKSDTSTSSVRGRETGRAVPLLIAPHSPTRAREANNYSIETILAVAGLSLMVAGLWLGHTAITAYPVSVMTWIMAAGMLIYLGFQIRRIMIPKGQRLSVAEWRKQHGLGEAASIDLARVKPIEQLVTGADIEQAVLAQARQNRRAAPIVGIFAVVLFAVGIYQSIKIARLEATGLRAQGEVIRLKSESSDHGSYSYYPIVRFRTENNTRVEFKDSVGSNPPSYRVGDTVAVLYLADNPSQEATIDRGLFWNWFFPALLFAGAVLLLCLLLAMRRTARQQAGRSPLAPTVAHGSA
jgi:hypothetical protein